MGNRSNKMPDSLRGRLCGARYRIVDSARYAQVHPQTLSRWFNGSIPANPDKRRRGRVSYMQTLEAAFVGTFRSLGMPLPRIRKLRDRLAITLGAEFPFGVADFPVHGLDVAADLCGNGDAPSGPIVSDPSGGEAWHPLVAERIAQCDYDDEYGLALRWFFLGRSVPLLIDPGISSGAPIVPGGIATWALAGLFKGGQRRESILSDFPYVTPEALDAALEYEGLLQEAA